MRPTTDTEAARLYNAAWQVFKQLALELPAADPPKPPEPPPAYRVGLFLREMGKWDGVSCLHIVEPQALWRALNAGDITLEELEEGSHYIIRNEAHR